MDHAETLERVCAERDAARAECDRLSRDLHATLVAHRAAEREADNWYELAMALGAERGEAAQDMMATANAALRERDAARAEVADMRLRAATAIDAAERVRAELAAVTQALDDAGVQSLKFRDERDAAREGLDARDALLREWLAAWERTTEGDRVRATEAALRGEE